jgi:hypothetical protein
MRVLELLAINPSRRKELAREPKGAYAGDRPDGTIQEARGTRVTGAAAAFAYGSSPYTVNAF